MEMHVQALAIDSARDNVDLHFSYICRYQVGGLLRTSSRPTLNFLLLLHAPYLVHALVLTDPLASWRA